MASTSGREEDDDALLEFMAEAMISRLKRGDSSKAVPVLGAKSGQKGPVDDAAFLSISNEEDAAVEATLASKQLSWMPDLGLGASPNNSTEAKEKPKREEKVPVLVEKDGLLPPRDPRRERREAQKARAQTAGPKWFDLPATTITPEVKRDLRLLKLRGVLDPKRHYKAPDSTRLPKYFQIGTVVEGPTDYYSGRLTKSERKPSLTAELLADQRLKSYRKRKYSQIQEEKEAGGKKWFKKKKSKQKPSWART